MALTLVATVGAASANSFATLAEAEVVAGERFPPLDAWTLASDDDKNRALLQARYDLEQERFPGDRVDETQALEWPRRGVRKQYQSSLYLTTEIPAPIKRAQILRAIYLVEHVTANAGSLVPDDLAGVSSFSLGGEVSVTLDGSVSSQSERDRYFATVIRPLLGALVYAPQPRLVRG